MAVALKWSDRHLHTCRFRFAHLFDLVASTTGGEAAGLLPHMHHPPRRITVLLRKQKVGRSFENQADFVAAVVATGLPVEFIEDMGKLTFKEQVCIHGVTTERHMRTVVRPVYRFQIYELPFTTVRFD